MNGREDVADTLSSHWILIIRKSIRLIWPVLECVSVRLSVFFALPRTVGHPFKSYSFSCVTHLSICLLNNTCIYRCKRVLITNIQTDVNGIMNCFFFFVFFSDASKSIVRTRDKPIFYWPTHNFIELFDTNEMDSGGLRAGNYVCWSTPLPRLFSCVVLRCGEAWWRP